MKTMKYYYHLYLKCDILLLADDFGKFWNNGIKNYGLYPSHYLSAPALSWDTMLNITEVELELISDLDIYIFFEKGMRGRISYVSNECSKANSNYLNPQQEWKHTIYLDANNLYGYAMSKFRSTNCFKWLNPKTFDLNKYTTNSSKGCFLEGDLEYSKELREFHNVISFSSR